MKIAEKRTTFIRGAILGLTPNCTHNLSQTASLLSHLICKLLTNTIKCFHLSHFKNLFLLIKGSYAFVLPIILLHLYLHQNIYNSSRFTFHNIFTSLDFSCVVDQSNFLFQNIDLHAYPSNY